MNALKQKMNPWLAFTLVFLTALVCALAVLASINQPGLQIESRALVTGK